MASWLSFHSESTLSASKRMDGSSFSCRPHSSFEFPSYARGNSHLQLVSFLTSDQCGVTFFSACNGLIAEDFNLPSRQRLLGAAHDDACSFVTISTMLLNTGGQARRSRGNPGLEPDRFHRWCVALPSHFQIIL